MTKCQRCAHCLPLIQWCLRIWVRKTPMRELPTGGCFLWIDAAEVKQ